MNIPPLNFAAVTGPTESHLEAFFLWAATKYLDPAVYCDLQVPVMTERANFRLDVLLRRGDNRIAVELDGAAYHDAQMDLLRDACILQAGFVPSIIRLRAKDVFRHREFVLWLLAQIAPWLVSDRGRVVLEGQRREHLTSEPFIWDTGTTLCAALRDEPECEDEPDSDRDAEPREPEWGDTLLIGRHDKHNPQIRHAMDLLTHHPWHSLKDLKHLLAT